MTRLRYQNAMVSPLVFLADPPERDHVAIRPATSPSITAWQDGRFIKVQLGQPHFRDGGQSHISWNA